MKRSDVYTTGQLAEIAGIERRTVWSAIQRNQLESVQFDERGWHYIMKEEADRWLAWREARRVAGDHRLTVLRRAA